MKSKILHTSVLMACAGFFMSATKCSQPVEQRALKKNIKVMQIEASSFLDNAGFNFSEVAKSQFSGVLFEKNNFFERNVYPSLEDMVLPDQNYFNVKKASLGADKISVSPTVAQIKKWFPQAKSQDLAFSRNSACLISRPQHFIAGKINSLEAYSGAAFQFGFNQSLVQLPIEAKFKMDKMRMDLSFHAYNPWTQQVVGSVNAEAFKKDYSAGFGIDLGIIHIGPEFYRVTGMAEVTLAGLRASVTSLAQKLLSSPGEDWSTRVIYSGDNNIVILGGAELGIKPGDQFKIYNQIHTWHGEACGESSILTGSTVVSDAQDPWIVQIDDAGTLMSKAHILNVKDGSSVDLGALVKLHMYTEQVQALAAAQAEAKPNPK
ncbi:MAG: hypothetical protein H7328_07355 [Bdellovibrio sp.]|nr:hypothetical protein [Bdellovibrio sp.]